MCTTFQHGTGLGMKILFAVSLLCSISLYALPKDKTNDKVVVKEVSKTQYLIEGEYDGERIELSCFPTRSDCVLPDLGTYLLVTLPAGEGDYMDCRHDVELYSMDKTEKPLKKLGQYCASMGD